MHNGKTTWGKIGALAMALLLCTLLFSPVGTMASDEDALGSSSLGTSTIYFEITLSDAYRVQEDEGSDDVNIAMARYYSSGTTSDRYNYSSYLSGASLDIYKQLKANVNKPAGPAPISIPITFTPPLQYTYTGPVGGENQYLGQEVSKVMQAAQDAFLYDHPEVYWMYFPGTISGISATNTGNVYTVTGLTIPMGVAADYQSDDAAVTARVKTIANNAKQAGTTEYDWLKYAHDEIAKNTVYDQNTFQTPPGPGFNRPFSAAGALLDNKSVCEGYAKAFKLVCDDLGIPCQLVSGDGYGSSGVAEPHMWNAVQVNNIWYGVDVTWDAQPNKPGGVVHDFFLVGSDTKDENFQKKAFKDSHVADTDFSNSGSTIFSYMPLSTDKYSPGSGSGGGGGTGGGSGSGGGGSSGGSSSGGGGGSSSGSSTLPGPSRSAVGAYAPVSTKDMTNAMNTALAQGGGSVNLRLVNRGTVSLEILRSISKQADESGATVKIRADQVDETFAVKNRLTLDPAQATTALDLRVSYDRADTSAVQQRVGKTFSNKTQVLALFQQGGYGMQVQIMSKVDLAGMSTANLEFYSYDMQTGTYTHIAKPNYRIDDKGYLHFTTELGGYIIISEGRLA